MSHVWIPDPAGIYFSDRFQVTPDTLDEYGAFDISVVTDLPLFIDPFLLFNSSNATYQALHNQIIDYLRFLQSKAGVTLDPHLISAWYRFGEVPQNWLGFSVDGNRGHGLGSQFATSLNTALTTILANLGSETVTESTHLEKLALIRPRVGRDNISDFTTNLIKHFLLTYTQTFAVAHIDPALLSTFAVPRAAFNYSTESWATASYTLPALGPDFVLLTPIDLLTTDDTWINRADMVRKYPNLPPAVSDAEQRALINNYFKSLLGKKPTNRETLAARAATIAAFPELVDHYIKLKEDTRAQATAVSLERVAVVQEVLVEQVRLASEDLAAKTDFYTRPWTSYAEALDAVAVFKEYVEHKDGYRVINAGSGKAFATETQVQGFFGLLLATSRFDVNREPNNGRGPVDFKISLGAFDKSLIEFKLAKSTSLKRNLSNQVAIYERANGTRQSVTVIICYTEADQDKVASVMRELELTTEPAIVVIDARSDNKPSASVA